MKNKLLTTICFFLVLAACVPPMISTAIQQPTASPTATVTPTPPGLFDYDKSIPFDTRVTSETQREGVTVVDLTYATHDPAFSSTTGGRTVAYLIKPEGEGPFAGVIYLHWLGYTSGNRKEFLEEAVETARHGAIALVLQGFFPWMASPLGTQADYPLIVGQAIELRRAVDFLLSQPGVDPKRTGFVGHDYGALYGGMLAGTDHRLKTYVLVAGVPSFADWIASFHIQHDPYVPIVEPVDPIRYISKAAPASLLFQFGQQDAFIPESLANQYYDSASDPKHVEWFKDVHEMRTEAVRQARLSWLIEQLGLSPNP